MTPILEGRELSNQCAAILTFFCVSLQVTLHAHASQETGHMSHLVSLLDSKTFEVSKNKPRCLLKGQSAMVEVTLSRTMCIETYKDYRALGRIALRDGGRTIAVGTVIQIFD